MLLQDTLRQLLNGSEKVQDQPVVAAGKRQQGTDVPPGYDNEVKTVATARLLAEVVRYRSCRHRTATVVSELVSCYGVGSA